MKIPKIISKKNRKYIFEKQINNNVFLYKEKIYGYKEIGRASCRERV